MKIDDVHILNWTPHRETWWNEVQAQPTEPLISARLVVTMSWNEYAEFVLNAWKKRERVYNPLPK